MCVVEQSPPDLFMATRFARSLPLHTSLSPDFFSFPLRAVVILYRCRSLAATGRYKVRGLVRNLEKAGASFSGIDGVELQEGNIKDEASLGAAMKVRKSVLAL